MLDRFADGLNHAFSVIGVDFILKCIECARECSGFVAVDLFEPAGPRNFRGTHAVLPCSHPPGVQGQLQTQFRGFRFFTRIAFVLTCQAFAFEQLRLQAFNPSSFGHVAEDQHCSEYLSYSISDR